MSTVVSTEAPPLRYPKVAQPWIALFLAILAELGIALFVLSVVAVPLIAVWVGIPLLLVVIPAARWFANCHRTMLAGFLGERIPRPYKKPPMPGMLMRLRTILTDPQTWRDIIWLLVNAVIGFTLCLLSAVLFLATLFYTVYPLLVGVTPEGIFTEPFGGLFTVNFWTSFLLLPVALFAFMIWYAAGERLLKANAYVARSLLGPTESAKLAMRVRELKESRAETVDTQAAELRRIERDLHDGAQARLAALSMNLGMAEEMVARDPAQAAALLTEARQSASTALSELRDLVRGIHPPVLADRGLEGAVKALALTCPFKVDVSYDVPARPPAPVESAAYFAVAECLANAVKYSSATNAWVQITHEDEKLHMIVGDDGVGGAAVKPGGGLYGIERRLAAFDGTLTVVSPSAGPTTVIMELPCESSSLKTTPSSGTA
ncbi:sensor histidine kinase [Kribbella sp. NPDC048915]|uniref:sensor histidine kinase n=1 Tax=Kribbella sp. NPDC048915 TaxID=3155148 RepID=UPI0033C40122